MRFLAEILDRIDSYLAGWSSACELGGWIVANIQRSMDSSDANASRILDEVDVSFVELGEGIIDLAEFNEWLASLSEEARALP